LALNKSGSLGTALGNNLNDGQECRTTMFYRRHLPHWQKTDSALFITWRLYGSLPRKLSASYLKELNPGKRFLLLDRELDKARFGPTWLKDGALAKTVIDALFHGAEQLRLYRLSAYVVMSNHVHVLLWPHALMSRVTKSIKGYTARECNKLLGRSGETFWQDESFDHAVRSEDEFYRIKNYIERNPVKAGLVESPEEWPWSSAAKNK
jgi:REP element-mobilizing transposase RayT